MQEIIANNKTCLNEMLQFQLCGAQNHQNKND